MFVKNKSVASITSNLTKMVDELRDYAILAAGKADRKYSEAQALRAEGEALVDESSKASNTADKIAALLN